MFDSPPLLVLKRTWTLRIVAGLFLLGPALAFLALAAVGLQTPPVDPLFAGLLAFLAMVFGVAFSFAWRSESGREVRLHDEGISQVRGDRSVDLRWDEVDQIWLEATRSAGHGGLLVVALAAAVDALNKKGGTLDSAGTSVTVRLVGAGKTIKLTSADKGIVQAYEAALGRVNPRLTQQLWRQLQSGEKVSFGAKVSLSPEGIRADGLFGRGRPVPFGEIEKFQLANGQLVVGKKGAFFSAVKVPVKSVANVHVLLQLLGHLVQGGQAAPPPPGAGGASAQGLAPRF